MEEECVGVEAMSRLNSPTIPTSSGRDNARLPFLGNALVIRWLNLSIVPRSNKKSSQFPFQSRCCSILANVCAETHSPWHVASSDLLGQARILRRHSPCVALSTNAGSFPFSGRCRILNCELWELREGLSVVSISVTAESPHTMVGPCCRS